MHGDDNKLEVFHPPLEPDGYSDAATPVITARVQGDTHDRVVLTAGGNLVTGDGTVAATDRPVLYTGADFIPASGRRFPGRSHLHQVLVAGGAAGDLVVAGVKAIDLLTSVVQYVGAGVAVTDVVDLTDEFTISDDDEINNTGGTDTTGDVLMVTWQSGSWDGYDQVGIAFPAAQDTHAAVMLAAPGDWPSVDIHIIAIASAFGSGVVRLYRNGDVETAVNLTVAATYSGVAFEGVEFTDAADLGQILQMPLTRLGTDEDDTLAEDFCIIALYLTRGA